MKGGSDYVCTSAPQQYHDALYTETIGACLLRRGSCVLTQDTLRRAGWIPAAPFCAFSQLKGVSRIKTYLYIARLRMQTMLAYRFEVWSYLVLQILMMIAIGYFWRAVYAGVDISTMYPYRV